MDDESVPDEMDTNKHNKAAHSKNEQQAIESPALTAIVALFQTESQGRLSSFLRKKVIVKLDKITPCIFGEINHDYTESLILNFHILPHDKHALITSDFRFLHSVINLLYGGVVGNDTETIMQGLGKSGFKIASKIASIFLSVLQEIMIDNLKINFKLSDVSQQLSPIFKQQNSKKCYQISFNVLIDSVVSRFNLIIPEIVFSAAVSNESNEADLADQIEDVYPADDEQLIFDESGRKQLESSRVTVSVNLARINLKLKDVINLKAGDIIPIDDPTKVFVAINNKNVFHAFAGQSNLRRVVKIVDKL